MQHSLSSFSTSSPLLPANPKFNLANKETTSIGTVQTEAIPLPQEEKPLFSLQNASEETRGECKEGEAAEHFAKLSQDNALFQPLDVVAMVCSDTVTLLRHEHY